MRRFMSVLALVVVALAGCNDERAAASDPRAAASRQLAGVYPDQWRCDSIATTAVLGQLLGGAARPVDSAAPVERGLPHPCIYEVQARELEFWTFDIDCRDGMKQRADALFAQYKELSREAIEQYSARASADPPRPRDRGEVRPAPPRNGEVDDRQPRAKPEPAVEVAIGSKGLDHRGQGLIFIDDDAPCYVRIVGKDAARRRELGKLIAKNLTFANAPMTPRPQQ